MIVLSIVAILSAIAIPSYQLYIKKAKFSEIITQVTTYRNAVEMCAQLLGGLGDEQLNCGTPGKNEIPDDFQANTSVKTYVAHIETRYQKPDVLIAAISQGLGKSYHYVLIAHYLADSGLLVWTLDPSSNCLSAGLCH